MRELRQIWRFMLDNKMRLQVRYIRSADNKSDFWSRWEDRSTWTLRPQVLRPLVDQVRPTLDPFACAATRVVPRFCSRHVEPGALALDGSARSWTGEIVCLSPPWHLLPRVFAKIHADSCKGTLVLPYWPSQLWWPEALRLRARWHMLPPPRRSVVALHRRMVEPFTNKVVQLAILFFDERMSSTAGRCCARRGL